MTNGSARTRTTTKRRRTARTLKEKAADPAYEPRLELVDNSIEALIDSWERHLRAANRSPTTLRSYRFSAEHLAGFLRERGMPVAVDKMHREHVEAFIEHVLEVNKPATAGIRYRSLQQLFKWLIDEGEVTTNPMAKMRPPKIPEPITPILSPEEVRVLIKAADVNTFTGRRDVAIIRVLADCGLRLSECAGLRWTPHDPERNDVFLNDGLLRVMGKGSKVRVVPYGVATAKAIDKYLRKRDARPDRRLEAFWLGSKGAMGTSGITQMLRRVAKRAGINKKVHPHMFRHGVAHSLLSAGMSEGDLMKIMGWSSPQMARRYGAVGAEQRAIDSFRRLSPMDRL